MNAPHLMHGFPPSPDAQVTLANWRKPPFNKWAFSHVREIVPSADIPNDPAGIARLPQGGNALASLDFAIAGERWDLARFAARTDTDGLVVLRDGKIVHEYYAGETTPATPHILMSISKSVLGLLVGILVERGTLDLTHPVTRWIPEIRGSAYEGATLRDLLDMQAGVKFEENYEAQGGAIIAYRKAQNWDPLEIGESPSDLRRFFSMLQETDGRHGGDFHYVSPNTDLLGWVIERAADRRYADLVSELIWQPMGAEHSAYITVDRLGAPRCAGGFCATTRDLARLGQLMVDEGRRDGKAIVPAAWIKDIVEGGNRSAWQSGDFIPYFGDLPIRYRSKWYVLDAGRPIVFGVGVHGQNVFADLERRIVIAKFSSQPVALDRDLITLTLTGVRAMLDALS